MGLKNNQRQALLSYLELPNAADNSGRKSIANSSHRYVERLLNSVKDVFETIVLEDQDLLNDIMFKEKLLKMIPQEGKTYSKFNIRLEVISTELLEDCRRYKF